MMTNGQMWTADFFGNQWIEMERHGTSCGCFSVGDRPKGELHLTFKWV